MDHTATMKNRRAPERYINFEERIIECLHQINRQQNRARDTMGDFIEEMREFQETVVSRLELLHEGLRGLQGLYTQNQAYVRDYGTVNLDTPDRHYTTRSKTRPPAIYSSTLRKVKHQSDPNPVSEYRIAEPLSGVSQPSGPAGTLPSTRGPHQHKLRHAHRQQLDIAVTERPCARLFEENPQEKDFVNLMKSLQMEVNPETICSVSSAAQVDSQEAILSDTAMHTVVVIDVSNSMNGDAFKAAKTFVHRVIDGIDETRNVLGLEEKVAVVLCGATTAILQHLTTDYDQIKSMLDEIEPEGRTPLMTALTLALCYVELKGHFITTGKDMVVAPRIIVVSDFNPTNDKHKFEGSDTETSQERIKIQQQLLHLASIYRRQGYALNCVPIGRDGNLSLASDLARSSGTGELFQPKDFRDVANYLRYQAVVGRIMEVYETSMEEGDDIDVTSLLDRTLPLAQLAEQHREAVTRVLDKVLAAENDDYLDDSDATMQVYTQHSTHEIGQNIGTDTRLPDRVPDSSVTPLAILPKWKATRNLSEFGLEEQARLPCIGSRVRRGPNWEYGNQDGGLPGTVIAHVNKGVVLVHFDNSYIGTYRFGHQDKYDIEKVTDVRRVPPGHIEIGCSVVRGVDWCRNDEDGGLGNVGVVVRKLKARCVMVRWPIGVIDTYRFGHEDKWDVKVSDREALSCGGLATTGQSAVVPGSAAPTQDEQPKRAWWKFKKDGQEIPFSEETVKDIEVKHAGHQDKALVKYRGESVRVYFKEMQCEMGGRKYELLRELLNEDDIKSMIELQNYLPTF